MVCLFWSLVHDLLKAELIGAFLGSLLASSVKYFWRGSDCSISLSTTGPSVNHRDGTCLKKVCVSTSSSSWINLKSSLLADEILKKEWIPTARSSTGEPYASRALQKLLCTTWRLQVPIFIIPGFPDSFKVLFTALNIVLLTFGHSLLNVSIYEGLTPSPSSCSTMAAATLAPSACPNINAVEKHLTISFCSSD